MVFRPLFGFGSRFLLVNFHLFFSHFMRRAYASKVSVFFGCLCIIFVMCELLVVCTDLYNSKYMLKDMEQSNLILIWTLVTRDEHPELNSQKIHKNILTTWSYFRWRKLRYLAQSPVRRPFLLVSINLFCLIRTYTKYYLYSNKGTLHHSAPNMRSRILSY